MNFFYPLPLDPANMDSKLRNDHNMTIQDLQRQLEQCIRTAENDTVRIRSRNEAEIADLKANIARLEANLEKVCRSLCLKERIF